MTLRNSISQYMLVGVSMFTVLTLRLTRLAELPEISVTRISKINSPYIFSVFHSLVADKKIIELTFETTQVVNKIATIDYQVNVQPLQR